MVRPLGEIDFGAPDANAEYMIASKQNAKPLFVEAYVAPPLSDIDGFRKGTRFLLLGLKGTGKTAVLRDLQQQAERQGQTVEFLIFRNEILEEKDLINFHWPLLIDDEKIKQSKHYLHCLKRILLSILIKMALANSNPDISSFPDDETSFFKKLYDRIRTSAPGRLVQIAFDTVFESLKAIEVDANRLSGGRVTLDIGRILKRQNDVLLENTCRLIRASGKPISLFVDEIHFAYRDEETLRQDAMLVRDTVQAVINLNERFIQEAINCTIYAGLRSEFVDHPLIAMAEINNSLLSFGETLSWATFPADHNHPMFEIAARRVENSIGSPFSKSKIIDSYFGAIDPQLFVESTWSKPRDIIRFFNAAKRMYPHRVSLTKPEFSAVLRQYAAESWLEIKTAATAFLPPAGIIRLEEVLRYIAPKSFEAGFRMTFQEFSDALEPVYKEIGTQTASAYSKSHLLQLLFILGLFFTRRRDVTGQSIVYAYHRGNRHPAEDGVVVLHRAVARAFS